MTSPESSLLRQRIQRVITGRVGSATGRGAVAEAVRLIHRDLAAALAPLISEAGVEALWGRAFDLVQREYPAGERREGSCTTDEPFAREAAWLERHDPSNATDAAAAMFATFAQLLTTLIGEPLTTRYMDMAWPDGPSGVAPKRKKA